MEYTEVLELIDSGRYCDAEDILDEKLPKLGKKIERQVKALAASLEEVRVEFPDAEYYTASGGFNLLLGPSHDDNERPLQCLVAKSYSNLIKIGDGDF